MFTPDATTTAVFASVGLSPTTIYNAFVGLITTAVDFSIWLIEVAWPFWLVIGFILLMWGLAHRYHFFGRS